MKDEVKLFRKYIQDKSIKYKSFKNDYLYGFAHPLKKSKYARAHPTEFERGYKAGVCHAINLVTKDLHKDQENMEDILKYEYIGTGLDWQKIL